jgi:hypothetical protein
MRRGANTENGLACTVKLRKGAVVRPYPPNALVPTLAGREALALELSVRRAVARPPARRLRRMVAAEAEDFMMMMGA